MKFKLLKHKNTKKQFLEATLERDRSLKINDLWTTTMYLRNLSHKFYTHSSLRELIFSGFPFAYSIHIRPHTNKSILKTTRSLRSTLEADQIARSSKGKLRKEEIDQEIQSISNFINEIVHNKQKAYEVKAIITLFAQKKSKLIKNSQNFKEKLREIGVNFNTYSFGQKQAFLSNLPFNKSHIPESFLIHTSLLSCFIPFISSEILEKKGIFLGINLFNKTPVFLNFFSARNMNINVFGVSGSGKSFSAKLLAKRLFLHDHKVVIIDPEGEYTTLGEKCKANIIKVGFHNPINPFGILDSKNIQYTNKNTQNNITSSQIYNTEVFATHLETNNEMTPKKKNISEEILFLRTFFNFFIKPRNQDNFLLEEALEKILNKSIPKNLNSLLHLLAGTKMEKDLKILQKG